MMIKYITLLRGINLGNKRKILMASLRKSFEKLCFSDVLTYIQTGNVIFFSEKKNDKLKLSEKIKLMIFSDYGFDVPVIIRTAIELDEIILNNPFLGEDDLKIENLHVTFLDNIPSKENIQKLEPFSCAPDKFKIVGNNVFIYCPRKYSETKLGNNFFEKKLNVTASTRTWRTILKLSELAKTK